MTFRKFAYSLAYIVLFTWIVGSIFDSIGWALYFALVPFVVVAAVARRDSTNL